MTKKENEVAKVLREELKRRMQEFIIIIMNSWQRLFGESNLVIQRGRIVGCRDLVSTTSDVNIDT